MAKAKVSNPRKQFLWQLSFIKHPVDAYLFQKIKMPDISVDQVVHGDINRDVKTAGRVKIGNMTASKLSTTDGSDTWVHDWLMSCQDVTLGGGLVPKQYWETVLVTELAEDGISILNAWTCGEVFPVSVNGLSLDRLSSENTIEEIEFSVGICDKL